MKILILGGTGQVGWELRRALAPLGDVVAPGRSAADGLCGDLEQPDALRRMLRRLGPGLIANAAAWTDVDGAESDPDRAERVNAEAPGLLAAEAARLGAWLVHYSTDYVFDGSGQAPWREDDAAGPASVYGRTKWLGEEAVRAAAGRHLIFRTQWVYAARRHNFVRSVLRLALENESLEIVADQIGAPTGAELVADVTAHAVRTAAATAERGGTYHLAASGETSRHALALFIVDAARRAGWPIRVDDGAIVPVSSEARRDKAPRPLNTRLSLERIEQAFGLRLPDWRGGVARVIAELGDDDTFRKQGAP